MTVTISIFTHKPLSAKELRRAFAIALLCYLNYLYCDHVPVSAGYGTHRFCVLTASSVTVLCAWSRSIWVLLSCVFQLVPTTSTKLLFSVYTFGLIFALISVPNLFCVLFLRQLLVKAPFSSHVNSHVGRTDAVCFGVLSDSETPCFQFPGFNYSVTAVIGVNFVCPVFCVCCLHRCQLGYGQPVYPVRRILQVAEIYSFPYFSSLVLLAISVKFTCSRTVILRFVSFQS